MDIIICGWTAFQYMRKPPVVRMLEAWLSSHPEVVLPGNKDWCTTGAHESLRPAPECPIDVLACSEKERLRGKGFRSHRLTGADASLLTRSVHSAPLAQDRHKRRIDRITTPAVTLLTMAMDIGHEKLALAASELLGSFSVFTPNPFCQAILDGLVREGPVSRELAEVIRLVPRDIRSLARYGAWRQAYKRDGSPTSLWRRPAILTPGELDRLSEQTHNLRGSTTLSRAAYIALTGTASPFEAQAGILLGLPKQSGGEGLGTPLCNHPVRLSSSVALFAGQKTCYCDLFFSRGASRGKLAREPRHLDVECHSTTWHAHDDKAISDIRRINGLEAMGVRTSLITHDILINDRRMASFAQEMRRRMGMKPIELSPERERRRERLRREVLVDWETFGTFG